MANLFTVAPGLPIAAIAARHILAVLAPEARAEAVILVPTRRAAVTMREALQAELAGAPSLLPRILPLADMDNGLLSLLGSDALALLETIPPAMPDWQQRYLLAVQVAAFVRQRQGAVTLDYALALAEELMALQDQCARAGVRLTRGALAGLVGGDMAMHWEESLAFLSILAEHWPLLEGALGMTTASAREGMVIAALAEAWRDAPPAVPVFAVGSTASQESTALLLQVIAELPQGYVVLPGIDPAMDAAEWVAIAPGHPLYHLRHFMDRLGVGPEDVVPLAQNTRSVWLDALAATEEIPHWRARRLAAYDHIRLIPCAHAEEEARVIALLMREALETPDKITALVTPDQGLMTRVAAQMKRYGITIDRMERGTLGESDSGSLWGALLAAIAAPDRLIHLRSLLHHPLFAIDPYFLTLIEPYWYGVAVRRAGQLPRMAESVRAHVAFPVLEQLVRDMARLARARMLPSAWIAECEALLAPFSGVAGQAAEAVADALETIAEADMLGPVDIRECASLFEERFAQPMRHGGSATHPQLRMLNPIEARLQQFDRVILGAMVEPVWPGLASPNAWLNLAAQQALGLPSPLHHVSLMAHDMLMLGSGAEVFLTWPARDQGSPTTRSRFIERLVTYLAMHGVAELAITAEHYTQWASALDAADSFVPSAPIMPTPRAEERPVRLPVSALDTLFGDPFSIYARYVLGLKRVEDIDADAGASDFGSLAHKAIHALTEHWNVHGVSPDTAGLDAIADHALRDFAERPGAALFWRTRLVRALDFVNGLEEERRQSPRRVQAEEPIEAALGDVTLHGRMDRVEEGATVVDYKTGDIPTAKRILDGHATQLLAYAMLLEASGAPVSQVEYWRLPHGKHAGNVTTVGYAEMLAQGLPEALAAGLATMRDAATAFLATPGRLGHDYDGLSRYDEWAG